MYEKFTDRARKVMQLANEEAARFQHQYIGTEHILLGLIREGTGVAANVLMILDIDANKIRSEIEKIIPPGPVETISGRMPQTPRAKKVIEYAIDEARLFDHNYVGSEHLLLGLLRETEGLAAQVLMKLGLTLDGCREEVQRLLGYELAPPPAPLPETPVGDIDDFPERAFEIVKLFNRQLDLLQEEKEAFILDQKWTQAATLRDVQDGLKKLRAQYIFARSKE